MLSGTKYFPAVCESLRFGAATLRTTAAVFLPRSQDMKNLEEAATATVSSTVPKQRVPNILQLPVSEVAPELLL